MHVTLHLTEACDYAGDDIGFTIHCHQSINPHVPISQSFSDHKSYAKTFHWTGIFQSSSTVPG